MPISRNRSRQMIAEINAYVAELQAEINIAKKDPERESDVDAYILVMQSLRLSAQTVTVLL